MSDEMARAMATTAWLLMFGWAGWMLHEWFARKLIKKQQELIDETGAMLNRRVIDMRQLKDIIDAQERVRQDQVHRIDKLLKDLDDVKADRNHVASQLVDVKMARDLEMEALKNELAQHKEDNDEMQQDLKDTSRLLEETTKSRADFARQLDDMREERDTLSKLIEDRNIMWNKTMCRSFTIQDLVYLPPKTEEEEDDE